MLTLALLRYLYFCNSKCAGGSSNRRELWKGSDLSAVWSYSKNLGSYSCWCCCQSLWPWWVKIILKTRWAIYECLLIMIIHLNCVFIWAYLCAFLIGVSTRLPRPENLLKYAESCMYSPTYRNYRWVFWWNCMYMSCKLCTSYPLYAFYFLCLLWFPGLSKSIVSNFVWGETF